MKKQLGLAFLGAMGFLISTVLTVQAARNPILRVRCDVTPEQRSKVSVDLRRVQPGESFTATVTSGQNTSPPSMQTPALRKAEFDFDSDPDDIAAGATPIDVNFIVDGKVSVSVTGGGSTFEKNDVRCRTRRSAGAKTPRAVLRVRCESRFNGDGTNKRSKISVDLRRVASGEDFTATVMSGPNTSPPVTQTSALREAEFDFDSDNEDIAEGATAIAKDFIVDGKVSVSVTGGGSTFEKNDVQCRVRRR